MLNILPEFRELSHRSSELLHIFSKVFRIKIFRAVLPPFF